MRPVALSLAAMALLTSLSSTGARADIAPGVLFAGPGLAPPVGDAAAAKLRMKREKVVIELHETKDGAFAVVDATFWMGAPVDGKAGGKPTGLQVTFPGDGVIVGGAYQTHPKLRGFRAFVDGKPVASREETKTKTTEAGPPGNTYTRSRSEVWHVFPAAIDDDTVIRVRYAVETEPVGQGETHTHKSVQYILHTGAPWAGSIAEAVVEVRAAQPGSDGGVDLARTSVRNGGMAPVSLVSLVGDGPPPPVIPAGAVRSATAITWTLKELEPTPAHDVEVVFPSPGDGWGGPATPGLIARMEAAARG